MVGKIRKDFNMRYKNIANIIISVDITKDYTVFAEACVNKEKVVYTLYLKRNDIGMLSVIEKQENIEIASDYKHIKSDLLKIIEKLYEDNFFTYYINRYEYEQKCFEYGNNYYFTEKIEG